MSDEARLPVITWNDLSPATREWLRRTASAEGKPLEQVLAEVLEAQARREGSALPREADGKNEAV